MKTGIIDVGGGLRGIYGAGVLDRCMEEGVQFDCCIGVSAGSANMWPGSMAAISPFIRITPSAKST